MIVKNYNGRLFFEFEETDQRLKSRFEAKHLNQRLSEDCFGLVVVNEIYEKLKQFGVTPDTPIRYSWQLSAFYVDSQSIMSNDE